MKSTTQAFLDRLSAPAYIASKHAYYKRRYWDFPTAAYKWESNWTQVPDDHISSTSTITGQLDTERLNEFRISNVTLVLKNELNQWLWKNPQGNFAPDAGSSLGYEASWTKFQVQAGVVKSDGTEEVVTMFTGLATTFLADPNSGTVQITIQGLETLLMNGNAENVSTTVTEENAGTGNGATTAFITLQPGVGMVDLVSLNGIAQKLGVDYDVSDLSVATVGATVTFKVAPANAVVVRISYRYWQQNKRVETLVKSLLTEAGIDSGNQLVDPAVFPAAVSQLFTQDTQSDWVAGTTTGTTPTSSPGDVKIDFGWSSYKALWDSTSSMTGWTSVLGSGGGAGTSTFGGSFYVTAGASGATYMSKANSDVVGLWRIWMLLDTYPASKTVAYFLCASNDVGGNNALWIEYGYDVPTHGGGYLRMYHVWVDFVNSTAGIIDGGTYTFTADANNHFFDIERHANGLCIVKMDNVARLSAYINPPVPLQGGQIVLKVGNGTVRFQNISTPNLVGQTPQFVSQTLDALTTPIFWGRITPAQDLNGGTILYETRVSTDGISWDAYVAVSANGQINSALKRYLQVRVTLTVPSTAYPPSDPTIHSFTLQYQNSATLITLANFTSKTCYQAIQDLGAFCNYEWGFNADETFFFRSKIVSTTVDMTFAQNQNILADGLISFSDGFDKVYSEVEANYGAYDVLMKDDGKSPASPHARFLTSRLSLDDNGILIPADTDLATAVAVIFYQFYSQARRRCTLRTKFYPAGELADTISLTYLDNLPARQWFWGDTNRYWGEPDIYCYGGAEQIIPAGMLFKVVGFRHDLENWQSEFDLEEILT